ncbi:MAG: hypothetical protein ACKVPX_08940 [Myxococcaceae bacterium]
MTVRVVVAAVLLSGCILNLEDYAERGCDAQNECLDGRVCDFATGQCISPTAGACVRWQQATSGFTRTQACTGCSLAVDATSAGRVEASVLSGDEESDFAFARYSAASLDVLGAQGKVRGRVTLTGGTVRHPASFFALQSSGGTPLVELSVIDNRGLRIDSAAATLQGTVMLEDFGNDLFTFGVSALLEVRWRRGIERVVFFNGNELSRQSLTAFSTPFGPTEVRLGILDYQGDATDGFSIALSEWEVCDDPDA